MSHARGAFYPVVMGQPVAAFDCHFGTGINVRQVAKARSEIVTIARKADSQAVQARPEGGEEELQAFFRLSAVGMAEVDIATGRFIRVNPRFCEITGYTAQELLALSSLELIHPDDREGRDRFERTAPGDTVSPATEHRYVRKDGAVVWVYVAAGIARDASGQPVRNAMTVIDVTERKRAEQATLAQYKLAEAVFNHSISSLVILDRDYNFVRVNEAYAKACRRPITEFSGRNHFEMYPSDAKAIFDDVVRTRRPFATFTRPFVFPDQPDRGVTYWDWTLVPILDPAGEIEYLAFSLNEVTERKRAEERSRAMADRLRELAWRLMNTEENERRSINRELHDRIGQGLSALNLNLNLIRARLPADALVNVASRFDDSQLLLETLVQNVRDIMADLRPTALDDYGLLAALRTYAQSASARLGIPVTVAGENIEPRLQSATETALFRITQEALANIGVHAHAKRVEIRLAPNNEHVTLDITDNGIGFDTGLVARDREKRGLKIMRERAEAVGADLHIESAPGQGTRVAVKVSRGPA